MKSTILATTALWFGAGLMLSAGAQAHIGGHALDESQCRAAWAMASPNGAAIGQNEAELYVVNFIYVDDDGDGQLSPEEFKAACANGLMSDAAVTMSEECTDAHIVQMNDMIDMIPDAAKKSDAMAQLEMSKAALKNGDITECAKHMVEAHKDMGM
jgi:hypothetical protein